MKKKLILLVLSIIAWGGLTAQVDTINQKFQFECMEGDTLFNDPYCHFCPPDQVYEMWGLKITSPNNRVKYIRHPYLAEVRSKDLIWITYDVDSSFTVDWRLTEFPSIGPAIDSLNSCPLPPPDTVCCPVIDTFLLRNDTLFISLTSEDSLHFVVLTDLVGGGDCCNGGGITVFREYFSNVTGDSVIVTVNNGVLPDSADFIWVIREGYKQIEGGPGLGDYQINGSQIDFTYQLDGEDIEVLFMYDTLTCNNIQVSREYFYDHSGTIITPGRPLPTNPNWVKVFVEGDEQHMGGDYIINGPDVEFQYTLDGEDVEVWFIEDINCELLVYKQTFSNVSGSSILMTVNGGNLPALVQAVWVFVEGFKEQDGSTGDYEISGSTINFAYTLDSEDVEVWFFIGAIDVGFIGQFQTN